MSTNYDHCHAPTPDRQLPPTSYPRLPPTSASTYSITTTATTPPMKFYSNLETAKRSVVQHHIERILRSIQICSALVRHHLSQAGSSVTVLVLRVFCVSSFCMGFERNWLWYTSR